MLKLYINAIGMATNGMQNWAVASKVLSGRKAYYPEPLDRYKPCLLPPNEKRRSTNLVRLAFRVCEEIVGNHPEVAGEAMSVFASSGGDYHIIDQICRVLSGSGRALSPTQFHNSVHNSAAGYWSIATQSMRPSTSLSCHDHTFAAGFLEAATMASEAAQPVLLVVYDTEAPKPLLAKRQIEFPFATALLLALEKTNNTLAEITIQQCSSSEYSSCKQSDIETLRKGNPAARALPLLERIAKKQCGTIVLEMPGNSALQLDISIEN